MKTSKAFTCAIADYQTRTGRHENDFSVFHFPQTWGNTLAMFSRQGEVAGQAITRSYTTVILDRGTGHVYCDGRPVYRAANIEGTFLEDLRAMNMAGLETSESRYSGYTSLI